MSRFLISGGGTGGHFFPALALTEWLVKRNYKTIFVGSVRGIEFSLKELLPSEAIFLTSYPFVGVAWHRKLYALVHIAVSSLRLLRHIESRDISVVFGGYASLPLGVASVVRGARLFLHEQNSVPSRTNRLLSNRSEKIFVTFEYSKKFFPLHKVVKTGLPVREQILRHLSLSKEEAREKLGLMTDKPVILVFGGSQGAQFLNTVTVELLSNLPFQSIHVTGDRDFPRVKELYREKKLRGVVFSFFHDMGLLYRASDLAICRAGASSITELSLYGLPALFVPYPHAADDHQFYNAKEIEDLGGGITVRQQEATVEKLREALEKILSDRDRYSEGIRKFALPDACERIFQSTQ
ncbi:UDP-N-acetylglucosamine--N-acetylmuramyl- (pentapeptide) pyrophosphoryl-undecaprenol N- acetylglucosamine transferase [Thermocrinis albus DSM 14484]|uniref:UDP-N-acetylglucosamine--N-acetylmuramyl-(pentapeptide) pyrophosphoryl-undecaprenol N-acetylglucosamine transferase n=1 Tax=Thermocrinis albus (strain DSM 14484 / JCM 11386 / HI 11/12) TaxID=638303 RepID=D3SM56_THEAH|nr:undecaprenyldiphospho-muramoylpentapeptide beta-N-acetylglucosaminyltransferase [Thermocrinis albus]ADC89836.1 UDP-N-acetylglucosamine--N-acetylmuramyl- (pentapeptide) pyrophosphoryl-undecaprenol N- acetylglucosamine transferase [Thermocrinis albus DSM 14484]